MATAVALIALALIAYGLLIGPIGTDGLMLAVIAAAVAAILLAIFPRADAPAPADIATASPAELPAKVDNWLDRQRRALPIAAGPMVDAISTRLAALAPQLALIDARDPVAHDLNRLLGRHLPELVERYRSVPETHRSRPLEADGPSIERKLIDGLGVIDAELARVSDQLAAGHRDAFLTQGRFLETRYGNGDEIAR